MNRIATLLREINENSSVIAKNNNKNKLKIQLDMIKCMFKYQASPNNYLKFDFCNLTEAQKNTYVTYGLSRQMIKTLNDKENMIYFEDKLKFANEFSDFFKRKFISSDNLSLDDFLDFVGNNSKIILKPVNGSQGRKIKVFHIDNNLDEIYASIKNDFSKGYIIEEWIEQHEVLSNIYPDAVNCLRVITVFDGNSTHLITGGVTFSLETEIANGSQPSIVAPVNMQTGIIDKPAATFFSELYPNHPTTNAQILGVQLPYWKETMDMLDNAARRVKNVNYIGWDIAITPQGPVIIEGNSIPGYIYYQIPAHCDNGIGNKEKYIEFLK